MRKNTFLLIVLMAYPAFAQVSSGTIIVINRTKDKVVVAADSRGVNDNGASPNNAYCKVSAFSHQFVFIAVGHASYAKAPIDLIESWDNAELARDTIHAVPKKDDIAAYLIDLATYWGNTVGQHWDSLCKLNRPRCEKLVETSNGILTDGIFIGPKTLLSGATVSFDSGSFFNSVGYTTRTKLSQCWPCGQEAGKEICVAGSHPDIAANICAKRHRRDRIRTLAQLRNVDRDTRLPVQIVESTIAAYDKSAGDVGGPVDIISITTSGSIHWIKRKENCPENQD
jgi:hypothetical protein